MVGVVPSACAVFSCALRYSASRYSLNTHALDPDHPCRGICRRVSASSLLLCQALGSPALPPPPYHQETCRVSQSVPTSPPPPPHYKDLCAKFPPSYFFSFPDFTPPGRGTGGIGGAVGTGDAGRLGLTGVGGGAGGTSVRFCRLGPEFLYVPKPLQKPVNPDFLEKLG